MLYNTEVKLVARIVTFDGEKYYSEKRFGLVGDNFNKEKVLNNLKGMQLAIQIQYNWKQYIKKHGSFFC